jgi:hypothetical protein
MHSVDYSFKVNHLSVKSKLAINISIVILIKPKPGSLSTILQNKIDLLPSIFILQFSIFNFFQSNNRSKPARRFFGTIGKKIICPAPGAHLTGLNIFSQDTGID